MLGSEFKQEMGALIRQLEAKVSLEPSLRYTDPLEHIERAIVSLVALHVSLRRVRDAE